MQKRIVNGIESRIGRDGELYKTGVGNAGLGTYNNALMALYFALQEGAGAGGGMKIKVPKNTEAQGMLMTD